VAEYRNKKRAFIVDDEHAVASTLAWVLNSAGFDAVPFTEPMEALKAAQMAPPDLLLSDVVMPNLGGIDLATQVIENCPGCKVLLFSGMPESIDLLSAGHARGLLFECLPKPIHPKKLLSSIEHATGATHSPTGSNAATRSTSPVRSASIDFAGS
jgi:DNA-binding NtrC family response regulator